MTISNNYYFLLIYKNSDFVRLLLFDKNNARTQTLNADIEYNCSIFLS